MFQDRLLVQPKRNRARDDDHARRSEEHATGSTSSGKHAEKRAGIKGHKSMKAILGSRGDASAFPELCSKCHGDSFSDE